MFPSFNTYAFAAALGLVPLLFVVASGGSGAETTTPSLSAQPVAAKARETATECRAARAALQAELASLRQSCDVEVQEFEACRAARPEWRDVELFSCGFEMSTSLTRGDVADPASIEDCGTPNAAEPELRSNCPVPACEAELEEVEAELEALEETAARDAC